MKKFIIFMVLCFSVFYVCRLYAENFVSEIMISDNEDQNRMKAEAERRNQERLDAERKGEATRHQQEKEEARQKAEAERRNQERLDAERKGEAIRRYHENHGTGINADMTGHRHDRLDAERKAEAIRRHNEESQLRKQQEEERRHRERIEAERRLLEEERRRRHRHENHRKHYNYYSNTYVEGDTYIITAPNDTSQSDDSYYVSPDNVAGGNDQEQEYQARPEPENEFEKSQIITQIIQKKSFIRDSDISAADSVFCSHFLKSLQKGDKSIVFVEPLVRTDDPGDPELLKNIGCFGKSGSSETVRKNIRMAGDRGFRLYRIRRGISSVSSPEEFILYGEPDYNNSRTGFSAGYSGIDRTDCRIRHEIFVNQGEARSIAASSENYNAIVRYKNQYYILDLIDAGTNSETIPDYVIKLHRYSEKKGAFEQDAHAYWTQVVR